MIDNDGSGLNGSTSHISPPSDSVPTEGERETAAQPSTDTFPLYDLSSLRRDVLRVLASGECTGSEVLSILNQTYGKTVHNASIYPALDALIERGFVHKRSLDGRTNIYSITTRGRREFAVHREWMTRPLEAQFQWGDE